MTNRITICVCTYRRASLFNTLASFENQNGIQSEDFSVLVIDNDVTDDLRASVDNYAREHPFEIRYIHAPARNISIARNAALDNVTTRWLLFIDDDEIAHPDWLVRIGEQRSEAEAVIGQCIATYGTSLPAWAKRCDFHSNRITGRVDNAYTSNALIDLDFVRRNGLRFREQLGTTGGEDTLFFRQFAEAGGRMVYCEDAVVFEPVPTERATMQWVRRRMYRAGQTHGLICQELDQKAYRSLLFSAGAKAGASALMALITLPGSDRSRKWLARAYLHAGAVHYRISPRILEEYG